MAKKAVPKKAKSAGRQMVEKAKITFTPAAKKATAKKAVAYPSLDGEQLIWVKTGKTEWQTNLIPEGEACVPRIRELDPKTFACYRDTKYLGSVESYDAAVRHVAGGVVSEKNRVMEIWQREHPDELPPHLQMTAEERRLYWLHNPPKTAVRPAPSFGAPLPPGKSLRDAMAAPLGGGAHKAPPGSRAPRADRGALPQGKLERLRDGNPKKAGTGAHKRWDTLLVGHCDTGGTVAAYVASGGNPDTLANAIRMGWVKVHSGKGDG